MDEIPTRQKVAMTEEEFFLFIEQEIAKYKKHSEFEISEDITFDALQKKLMEYTSLSLSLTQLQARYRYQVKSLKRAFNRWFDEKVVEIQSKTNRLDIAKTKWLSSTELERLARVAYCDEYQTKLEEVDSMEAREKFINSLIDNWQSHNYVLGQLSSNIRSEIGTLNMGNRLSH
jgi:hypothetical protein